MRINLYGNILNNAFNYARYLRARNIEARVFVDDAGIEQNMPWWEDRALSRESLPDWIRLVNPLSLKGMLRDRRRFLREFNDCDLIHTFGYGPVWARRPFVFQSYGSDLSDYPFQTWRDLNIRKGLHAVLRKDHSGNFGLMGAFLGPLQKKGLHRAERLIYSMPRQVHPHGELSRLGLTGQAMFLPLLQDLSKYSKKEPDPQFSREFAPYEHIFFHPARHVFDRNGIFDEKGNNRVIEAFARFEAQHQGKGVLVLIEKGWDLPKSKELVKDLQVRHVRWLAEMSKEKMLAFYSLPQTVVIDQFQANPITRDLGFLGAIGIEAMACRCSLITNFRPDKLAPYLGQYFANRFPPVFAAWETEEILARMQEITVSPEAKIRQMTEACRQWVWQHYHWENGIERYIELYRTILAGHKGHTH